MQGPVVIAMAVEGPLDEAVGRKLISAVGAQPGTAYGKQGKQILLQKLPAYNHAAKHAPWLVLVDLDNDAHCAPLIGNKWLPSPAPLLCFRIAVRAVEAWLLADAQTLAPYLGIAGSKIPQEPETIAKPKAELINLARLSTKRSIRDDMVPRPESGRPVGPAYTARLIEYVQNHWRPRHAAARSDSLRRALACLAQLVAKCSRFVASGRGQR